MTTLNAKLREKAEKELNEKAERRDQDIEILRRLVVSNKALTCRTDTPFLLRFLRARKFDCERANQLLINYYAIREEYKERLDNLLPSSVKHVYDRGMSVVLPHKDREGRKIMYFRVGKWDPKAFPIWDVLKVNVQNMEKVVEDEETQINGVVAIGNFENTSWDHVKSMDRDYGKVFSKIMQEAFPLRFKGLFVVNEPGIFDFFMALMRPFMSEKFLSRITVVGSDLNKLHKVFDPAILPEELGGDLPHGDILSQEWGKKMLACDAQFAEMSRYKIELTKAITKGKSENGSAGSGSLSGTFRKLNVD